MTAMPEKVAIIGRGKVGSALEKRLQGSDLEVRTVGREPDRVAELAAWADTIVLAVPFGERENAIEEIGEGLEGKVLVDVTNAVTSEGTFAASAEQSGAERLAQMAPEARVVKAFNTVFAGNQAVAEVDGVQLDGFIAGDNADAKQAVADLLETVGFRVIDAGGLSAARYLEGMAYLNIAHNANNDLPWQSGWKLVGPIA